VTERSVDVCYVSRVEGQGSIRVDVTAKGEVQRAEFAIFEPARFFEALLKDRTFSEVHELTSRICGICPIAHQITALRAVENAYGIEVSRQTNDLRRLLALSGWIQSHTLSVFFLTAPDYLGFDGAIPMAAEHRELVESALRIKKLGNDIGELIGGRAIHPISAVVGGFTKVPAADELHPFLERLKKAKKDMLETVKPVGGFDYPVIDRQSELVCISDDERYAVNEGRLVSNQGLNVGEQEYRTRIVEGEVAYSNAKQSRVKGRGSFLVGPLARVALNHTSLTPGARRALGEIGLDLYSTDPFMNVRARVVETILGIEESVRIIKGLKVDTAERPVLAQTGVPCEGAALTEAPRGLLYHSYRFDKRGVVTAADIVPPTAHSSAHVEDSLKALSPRVVAQGGDLASKCEMLVRAYDPCISCSVHAVVVKKGG
jgi:coenzyme F420-reducing hydrogenase alpha subunit